MIILKIAKVKLLEKLAWYGMYVAGYLELVDNEILYRKIKVVIC